MKDALFFELDAHGRVNIGIAAGDDMPCRTGKQRNPPHEGAANTENMNVHGGEKTSVR